MAKSKKGDRISETKHRHSPRELNKILLSFGCFHVHEERLFKELFAFFCQSLRMKQLEKFYIVDLT